MKKMMTLFAVIGVLFLKTSIAHEQDNSTEVSKTEFITSVSQLFPTEFCKTIQYVNQCLGIKAQECEKAVKSATKICLSENDKNIPNILAIPKDGTYWGTVIGSCVGETYEVIFKKQINNSKCEKELSDIASHIARDRDNSDAREMEQKLYEVWLQQDIMRIQQETIDFQTEQTHRIYQQAMCGNLSGNCLLDY